MASANKTFSSSSSIKYENAVTIRGNTPLINCANFNVNRSKIKNSSEILDDIGPPLSHNINTPILVKHVQSNIELQALKNYFLKIELSILTNKAKTMSLYLSKTANTRQKSVNKNI